MAKVRSPNYPTMDLAAALAYARKAYGKDHRNKMSRLALAKHFGHDALTGPALTKIAALRAYGLIEGTGDELRITEDAVTVMMAPESAPERGEAVARLAFRPPLFQDIRKEFDGRVSEENLRYWLIKRSFTEDAASKAARAYLSCLDLVGANPAAYTAGPNDEDEDESNEHRDESDEIRDPPPGSRIPRKREVKPGMNEDTFTMKEGTVVLQWPDQLSLDSYEDLAAWAQLVLRKVKRHVVKNEDDEFLN